MITNHQYYDKYKRNKKAKKFYDSDPWQKCRLLALRRDYYLCQSCLRNKLITFANIVHHIKSLEDHPHLALVLNNLETVCDACHNAEHPEKGGGKPKEKTKVRVLAVDGNREIT
ncbi:HNH endonuclease [Cytobacillus purgationiresistens]|uniref:Putative HNH nuclease YajD n=1 Tax=Cytobacillus purgationiresistens TaxID=863449 RepID=A0ABU0ACA3_9BACI|nr:HNH endonuclease signature motif containing protein [Cytobacillus purgationiresistens]MDQ0268885.1 5-methylcytosine-specific restriction endonuclease McrA [Cytobacillus purgationiresistens]